MLTEIWKNIPGCEEIYQASNWGRIASFKNNKWGISKKRKILKPGKCNKRGHLSICLYKNCKSETCLIHRLVLETFVGPCPPGMECRHLDGDPSNNRLDNLCWGTRSENQLDRKIHGTASIGDHHGRSKLNEKQVRIIRWLCENTDMTNLEIAKIFNVHQNTISKIRNNETWKHVGVAGDNNADLRISLQ